MYFGGDRFIIIIDFSRRFGGFVPTASLRCAITQSIKYNADHLRKLHTFSPLVLIMTDFWWGHEQWKVEDSLQLTQFVSAVVGDDDQESRYLRSDRRKASRTRSTILGREGFILYPIHLCVKITQNMERGQNWVAYSRCWSVIQIWRDLCNHHAEGTVSPSSCTERKGNNCFVFSFLRWCVTGASLHAHFSKERDYFWTCCLPLQAWMLRPFDLIMIGRASNKKFHHEIHACCVLLRRTQDLPNAKFILFGPLVYWWVGASSAH